MDLLKLLFIIQIILCALHKCDSLVNSELTNVLAMTANFFSNLNQMKINKDEPLDEETKKFIDSQIDHYIEIIRRTHGLTTNTKNKLNKRSILSKDKDILSTDFIGVYVLNGFTEKASIPVYLPKDIILFKHEYGYDEVWYAATLETNNAHIKNEECLVIYRSENEQYFEIARVRITNGVKLAAHTIQDTTYIVVVENHKVQKKNLSEGTGVYEFYNEQLYKIQTLDVSYPSDVTIWEDTNQIFMAITQEKKNDSGVITYEVKSPIFKWLGKHFDIIHYIDTYCAQKIIAFKIGLVQYLAVANNKNDYDDSEIFSVIYKYDIQDETFIPYQKILTHAAVDIKYFCFKQNNIYESFLVVANSYELDYAGNINYRTNSIVYKYVEDYFMPFQSFTLNYAEQWVPVVGQNGEFLLLVSCKYDGVKVFQYDGWKFVESEVQYTKEAFSSGIMTMYPYLYYGEPIIVIANKNDRGNMVNIFAPIFTYQNAMTEFQDDMYIWCQQTLKEVDILDLKEMNRLVEKAPSLNDPEIHLKGKIVFTNATVDNLVVLDNKAKAVFRTPNDDQLTNLHAQIKNKSNQLRQLHERVNSSSPIILNGDIKVKNLNITNNDNIVFEDVRAKTINKVDIDKFLSDIIFIEDPFQIDDNFEFEDVIFDGFFEPKFVNNVPAKDLIRISTDSNIATDIIVEGNVFVNGLTIDGYLDGIKFTNNNILLVNGDQKLDGTITFSEIETDTLEVDFINNVNMKHLEHTHDFDFEYHNLTSLTVKNVTIHQINGIDINSLERLALRTRGDQEITSNYEFGTLIVNDFQIQGLLSGTKVTDLLSVTTGPHFIEQALIFTEDLEAKHVHVVERLNQVLVHNGKMDILLKNSTEKQFITGYKTFDNLNLLGPVKLQGKIRSDGLDRINPITIIDKNLTLTGDYTIAGGTTIEKTLKVEDITEPKEKYSFSRLYKQGLKLTDTEVPTHLDFKQELNVNNINVNLVNGIHVNSLVLSDTEQEITGRKIFENDVFVSGETCFVSINDINIEELYENGLKIHGNQIITGNYHFEHVTTNRVKSNKTYVDNILWENIMTVDTDQFINGTTVIKKLQASNFETNSMEIKGKILNFDFSEIIRDTAFIDTTNEVIGHKTFDKDLSFKHLNVRKIDDINIQKLQEEMLQWSGDIHIKKPVEIKEISVEKIVFKDLNGIKSENFGNLWLLKDGNQTIKGNHYFKSLSCNKDVITTSNVLNNINLNEIKENAIKIDEEFHLNIVHFVDSVGSKQQIIVSGIIKNINLVDAVLKSGVKEQIITGKKILSKNLTVNGYLHVDGLLSGINVGEMDKFATSNEEKEAANLVINGSAIFVADGKFNYLNDYNIENILKTTWFSDQNVELKGFITFVNISFEDELTVDGFVDDINLVWLSKNYFSKTRNQTISAKLDFTDGVIFAKDLISKNATIYGLVSDINVQKLNAETLQLGDQIFKSDMQFQYLKVTNNFNANGLINGLNLSTDVMRYDVFKNIVTGKKIIKNVIANSLEMPKASKIQDVKVNYWFENAVLLNGTFSVDGLKMFKKATFVENIDILGLFNTYLFTEEHILTKSTNQIITGRKIVNLKNSNSSLFIDNLKLNGRLNNISIDEFMQNQVKKTNNVTISAPKSVYKTITASNVNIEQLYQGIDIFQLIKNVSNLDKINDYSEEYEQLINYSKKIIEGLKYRAYFLDTYKVNQIIEDDIELIIPLKTEISVLAFLKNLRQSLVIYFSIWDDYIHEFVPDNKLEFNTEANIIFMSSLFFNNNPYLYIEQKNSNKGYTNTGYMYKITRNGLNFNTEPYETITNGTKFVTSFYFPDLKQDCILLIHGLENIVDIKCETSKYQLELYQQLTKNGLKASTLLINNIPYIFVSTNGSIINRNLEVWKYNENSRNFDLHQTLFVTNPQNIDTIYYLNSYYIVISSGLIDNAKFSGLISIQRFDENEEIFKDWQQLTIETPIDVKFAILPTQELVLYVITNSPSEPLIVYIYEGISGFKRKISSATISLVTSFGHFTMNDKHFVVAHHKNRVSVISAMFKY